MRRISATLALLLVTASLPADWFSLVKEIEIGSRGSVFWLENVALEGDRLVIPIGNHVYEVDLRSGESTQRFRTSYPVFATEFLHGELAYSEGAPDWRFLVTEGSTVNIYGAYLDRFGREDFRYLYTAPFIVDHNRIIFTVFEAGPGWEDYLNRTVLFDAVEVTFEVILETDFKNYVMGFDPATSTVLFEKEGERYSLYDLVSQDYLVDEIPVRSSKAHLLADESVLIETDEGKLVIYNRANDNLTEVTLGESYRRLVSKPLQRVLIALEEVEPPSPFASGTNVIRIYEY